MTTMVNEVEDRIGGRQASKKMDKILDFHCGISLSGHLLKCSCLLGLLYSILSNAKWSIQFDLILMDSSFPLCPGIKVRWSCSQRERTRTNWLETSMNPTWIRFLCSWSIWEDEGNKSSWCSCFQWPEWDHGNTNFWKRFITQFRLDQAIKTKENVPEVLRFLMT